MTSGAAKENSTKLIREAFANISRMDWASSNFSWEPLVMRKWTFNDVQAEFNQEPMDWHMPPFLASCTNALIYLPPFQRIGYKKVETFEKSKSFQYGMSTCLQHAGLAISLSSVWCRLHRAPLPHVRALVTREPASRGKERIALVSWVKIQMRVHQNILQQFFLNTTCLTLLVIKFTHIKNQLVVPAFHLKKQPQHLRFETHLLRPSLLDLSLYSKTNHSEQTELCWTVGNNLKQHLHLGIKDPASRALASRSAFKSWREMRAEDRWTKTSLYNILPVGHCPWYFHYIYLKETTKSHKQ